jgi:hypothetical protein
VDALQLVDLKRATAYRWMNAYASLAQRIGLDPLALPSADDVSGWDQLDAALVAASTGLTLRRLLLGWAKDGSEEHRMEELTDRAESGDMEAEAALERVAAGEMTLVQAMRGAAGAAATKGKERRDPVYLDLDGRTGEVKGLMPKALITLQNAFARWEYLDQSARNKVRAAWLELVAHLPEDLA